MGLQPFHTCSIFAFMAMFPVALLVNCAPVLEAGTVSSWQCSAFLKAAPAEVVIVANMEMTIFTFASEESSLW